MRVFSIIYENKEAIVCGQDNFESAISLAFPSVWNAGLEAQCDVQEITEPSIFYRDLDPD